MVKNVGNKSREDNSHAFSGGNFWDCLGAECFMGREGVSEKMGGAFNWKVPTFGGVEVQLAIFGPAGVDV